MKTIGVSGRAIVMVGSKKSTKIYCWWGMNESHKFEVGTIMANDIEEAKRHLLYHKKGGVYNLREINTTKEFESLGVYNRISSK